MAAMVLMARSEVCRTATAEMAASCRIAVTALVDTAVESAAESGGAGVATVLTIHADDAMVTGTTTLAVMAAISPSTASGARATTVDTDIGLKLSSCRQGLPHSPHLDLCRGKLF